MPYAKSNLTESSSPLITKNNNKNSNDMARVVAKKKSTPKTETKKRFKKDGDLEVQSSLLKSEDNADHSRNVSKSHSSTGLLEYGEE